jgi:hypothetical protein
MGFPGREHPSPREASAAVNTASFAQDVVLALSRILHQRPLTDRDRRALTRCRAMLERLSSREITLHKPGERALSPDAKTVAAFRAARSARQHRDDLDQMLGVVARALTDERAPQDLDRLRELREIFLSVGRLNLRAMADEDRDQGVADGWTPLVASSRF